MAEHQAGRSKEDLGRAFWDDPRVLEALNDLSSGGEEAAHALGHLRAMVAAEEMARAAAEATVSDLRARYGLSWKSIADAIDLSQPSTMQRYSKRQRRATAERQRRRRKG